MALATICCASCSHSTNKNTEGEEFKFSKDLSVSDSLALNDVFQIWNWKLTDSNLAIIDQTKGDTLLYVYAWPDFVRKDYSIRKGNGPGEFIVLNPGQAKDRNNMLVYDIMRRQAFLYEVEGKDNTPVAEFGLPVDGDGLALPITSLNQVNDSVFVAKVDGYDAPEWKIVNLKNQEILHSQNPVIADEKNPDIVFDFIQEAKNNRLMVAYEYIDRVEIYDITPDYKMELKEAYGADKISSGIADYQNKEGRSLSICSDDKNFYLLKSQEGEDAGNVVESYNIASGVREGLYSLDKSVESISIDPKGRLIGHMPDADQSIFYIWNLSASN